MYRVAILFVFILVTLSKRASGDDEGNIADHNGTNSTDQNDNKTNQIDITSDQNDTKTGQNEIKFPDQSKTKFTDSNGARFASLAKSALSVFERFGVTRVLLRACSTAETQIWWNIMNENKSASLLLLSGEKHNFNEGVLLDVRCEIGIKTMENIIKENTCPDNFPHMIIAAPSNSDLTPILKRFNLGREFVVDGLALAKPPKSEFPSVLRVAVPEEEMFTDPAGAIIASKLISHLRDTLKLTLSFRRGNLSDVLSGSADLVADAVPMDEKFMGSVAFLGRQIWRLRTLVLMKTPGSMWDTDALLIPFTTEVWLCVGGSILATALVLRSVAFFESREIDSHPQAGEEDSWSFSIMTAMGIMCAQGFTCATKWSGGRITLVLFEVYSLFVGLFYSSAMVTFLLTLPETKIKTAPDLVNWPLSIGVDPSYYSISDLVQSHDSIVQTVMSLKAESMSIWDALSIATEQPVAYLSGEHLAVSATGVALEVSTICRIDPVILRPDWPLSLVGSKAVLTPWLIERFRRASTLIAEVGILSGDTRRTAARPLICLQSDVTDTEAIGFRAIWPGLAILAVGHVLSVIILFAEISVHAWHRYKPLHSKSA